MFRTNGGVVVLDDGWCVKEVKHVLVETKGSWEIITIFWCQWFMINHQSLSNHSWQLHSTLDEFTSLLSAIQRKYYQMDLLDHKLEHHTDNWGTSFPQILWTNEFSHVQFQILCQWSLFFSLLLCTCLLSQISLGIWFMLNTYAIWSTQSLYLAKSLLQGVQFNDWVCVFHTYR